MVGPLILRPIEIQWKWDISLWGCRVLKAVVFFRQFCTNADQENRTNVQIGNTRHSRDQLTILITKQNVRNLSLLEVVSFRRFGRFCWFLNIPYRTLPANRRGRKSCLLFQTKGEMITKKIRWRILDEGSQAKNVWLGLKKSFSDKSPLDLPRHKTTGED